MDHKIEYVCKKCKNRYELNLDNIKFFCPYCDSEIVITELMEKHYEYLIKKEETERTRLHFEQDKIAKEVNKETNKDLRHTFIILVILLAIALLSHLFID